MKKIISALLVFAMFAANLVNITLPVSAYNISQNGVATSKQTSYMFPDASSKAIWWVDRNDKVEIICKDGDFYLLLYPFNNVPGKYIAAYTPANAISPSGNISDASNFYQNKKVKVKYDSTLYHSPSSENMTGISGANVTIRASVAKDNEVTILFEKSGFYFIKSTDATGFIETDRVEPIKETPPPPPPPPPGPTESQINIKNENSIPGELLKGTEYKQVGIIESTYDLKYVSIDVYDTSVSPSKWLFKYSTEPFTKTFDLANSNIGTKIKGLNAGSYEYIIYAADNNGFDKSVQYKVFKIIENPPPPPPHIKGYVVGTGTENLNMRSEAVAGTRIVAKIPPGAEITITGAVVNGFYPVSYNGSSGFASSNYISTTYDEEADLMSKLGQRIAKVYNYGSRPSVEGILGECVWYVRCRAVEKLNTSTGIRGNAKVWYQTAKNNGLVVSQTARKNSIACYSVGTYGHVIFIEAVFGDKIYYTEANVEKPISDGKISPLDGVLKVKTISQLQSLYSGSFQGYIYLK